MVVPAGWELSLDEQSSDRADGGLGPIEVTAGRCEAWRIVSATPNCGQAPVRSTRPGPVPVQQMVGAAGFEPTTTSPPDWCATRLRHAPTGVEV